jgi:hypothetical protein
MKCPHCQRIFAASLRDIAGELGASKSPAKAKASRTNGKLGGRPKKTNEKRTNTSAKAERTRVDGESIQR